MLVNFYRNSTDKLKLLLTLSLFIVAINPSIGATTHLSIESQPLPKAASRLDKRWVLIGESNSALFKSGEPGTTYYYLDTATVHQNSVVFQFWICELFSEDSFAFVSGIHKRISKWEYDSNKDLIRMGAISLFGEAEDATSSNNNKSEWISVRPGSTVEGLIKSALQYKQK